MIHDGNGRRGTCADSAVYLLGALRPAATDAFEEHLTGCSGCQRVCDEFGPAAGLLCGMPPAGATGPLGAAVLAVTTNRDRTSESGISAAGQ
ncbi:zf-HC2 domain-containing protein [Micromonospora lupini]|uniref:zf-HC2 domain-containing protein n=1 Tax=Micromonospora lupini TaxID=285679 RepID=UPI0033C83A52